ncbi:unnamed protein product [Linum trigynum]|uniref:Uncharacterized protein n=1 Tax=Linum trigynum TaxID=586398 RepID=A0AAV2C8N1_9ROSI
MCRGSESSIMATNFEPNYTSVWFIRTKYKLVRFDFLPKTEKGCCSLGSVASRGLLLLHFLPARQGAVEETEGEGKCDTGEAGVDRRSRASRLGSRGDAEMGIVSRSSVGSQQVVPQWLWVVAEREGRLSAAVLLAFFLSLSFFFVKASFPFRLIPQKLLGLRTHDGKSTIEWSWVVGIWAKGVVLLGVGGLGIGSVRIGLGAERVGLGH